MQIQGYLSCARIWWELTDANLVSIDSVFFFLTDLASFSLGKATICLYTKMGVNFGCHLFVCIFFSVNI